MIDMSIEELRQAAKYLGWYYEQIMNEVIDDLEAAEKSDAESIEMYHKSRDERDKLRNALQALVEHFENYIGDNECRPLENARAALEESK